MDAGCARERGVKRGTVRQLRTSPHSLADFELKVPEVRRLLSSRVADCSSASLGERQVDSFTIFRILGPEGAAGLKSTVNPDTQHFESSVGMYLSYEGDYARYPPTLDFVDELVHAVMHARISERRYHFFGSSVGEPARVIGRVEFESYKPFRLVKELSWLSPFARFKQTVAYAPYTPRDSDIGG